MLLQRQDKAAGRTAPAPEATEAPRDPQRAAHRGLSLDASEAALAPVQLKKDGPAKSPPPPVTQEGQKDAKAAGPKAKLDAAAVDKAVARLRAGAAWRGAVASYAQATGFGYVPLSDAERGRLLAALGPAMGKALEADGVSGGSAALLADGALVARLVEAVQADVYKAAPTEVYGRVTADVTLKDKAGKATVVTKGHVVKLVRADKSQLQVSGRVGGMPVSGTIEQAVFAREPGLTAVDDEKSVEVREEHGYLDMAPEKGKELTASGAAPTVSDVSQGAIGDCYLMAGMGAVAAHRPDLIAKMIAYDAGKNSYTVTFKERQADGAFKDVPIKVSAHLPSKSGYAPIYAQDGAHKGGNDAALWPAIIEKAYAVWKGDYQEIVGGSPGDAMEALTGAASTFPRMPAPKDVIKLFQGYEKDKKAVCCGTFDSLKGTSAKAFSGSGSGPYRAMLKVGAKAASLKEKSLKVDDTGKKVAQVRDAGGGKLTGADLASGSVEYEGGAVELSYRAGKAPGKAEDLSASYLYHELLSDALNVYGNHAYMFVRVDGDRIVMANPWGPNASYQPKPMSASEFVKYFEDISVNAPLKGK